MCVTTTLYLSTLNHRTYTFCFTVKQYFTISLACALSVCRYQDANPVSVNSNSQNVYILFYCQAIFYYFIGACVIWMPLPRCEPSICQLILFLYCQGIFYYFHWRSCNFYAATKMRTQYLSI